MAVNNTKRYLAVAEKCYEGAICTIFDLVTAKCPACMGSSGRLDHRF